MTAKFLRFVVFTAAAVVLLLFVPGLRDALSFSAPGTGPPTVKIKPTEAKLDGARWRVDGGGFSSGSKTYRVETCAPDCSGANPNRQLNRMIQQQLIRGLSLIYPDLPDFKGEIKPTRFC